jgi:hypothetical protein
LPNAILDPRVSDPLTLFPCFFYTLSGTSKKVTVSKDDTLILHGGGPRDSIDERCALLKESIAATASDYEKEKLQVKSINILEA